jgi:uncharacterized protein YdbL (DUF1318 family)
MTFLGRFRILTKILSVIALIGVMVLGGVWYATGQMTAIDGGYTGFLEKDAKSVSTIARVNRSIFEIRYLAYRIVAEPEPEAKKQTETLIGKALVENAKLTKLIKDTTPIYASQVDDIDREIVRLQSALQPMIKAALANQNAQALVILSSP